MCCGFVKPEKYRKKEKEEKLRARCFFFLMKFKIATGSKPVAFIFLPRVCYEPVAIPVYLINPINIATGLG